jgi:hypothetical protein
MVLSAIGVMFSPAVAFSLGPYTGTVVDSLTGEPVEGASVLVYWTKSIPEIIHERSETIAVKLVYTDHKGEYEIPSIVSNLGLTGRMESTNLIIYQPGYQAYIFKIWHDDPYAQKNLSFKETGNTVALERIPPGFSHMKHVEMIDHALWGINDYPYSYPLPQDHIGWEEMMKIKTNGSVERQELLRRLEWEKRRGQEEGTR